MLPNGKEIDFEDFFDSSLCGFIITNDRGRIIRVNQKVGLWLNVSPGSLTGKRFSDILAVGSKMYFETHLQPLLRLQSFFDEVAVELSDSGNGKLPVLLNGYERKDAQGQPLSLRFTLMKASERRIYEQNLQMAKMHAEAKLIAEQENAIVREQFIAVLGHDLRNPLGAVRMASQMLSRSANLGQDKRLVDILLTSIKRMSEMIDNIMDLARGRLGGGFKIVLQSIDLTKLLIEVSEELKTTWPDRIIEHKFDIDGEVECDPGRIAQLASNLLANAITHGSIDAPVKLEAVVAENFWKIAVSNKGIPIPAKDLKYLFHPFHREKSRSSQNGLGLGLYIASEIAIAHGGTLSVVSNEHETSFTLIVNRAEL